ncbi:RNA polymerase sigma-I factor [Bhargavaea beijingensis]|uniref:RNA polymerase sigma factor SigI n=1 Tax=Bhargavaea beijingensis TaxID=426756 RepID=A0A1G7BPE8_9BACL|nr:RNA polymerase sigma-I factor [Bhargavaea beijingensis]MCW1926762.1 RNA polymerase sigma-I factor [Bhargavaea beijingensis]SDE28346.1 RNA polymerase sigma factor [Bhargavaea beijingensis]
MLITTFNGFIRKTRGTASVEERVRLAQNGSEEELDGLLRSYSPFLKKAAYLACNRYIDEHDDEYSIALGGFHEAVMKYDRSRDASFMTFAHLVIRRKLIDHLRKESRAGLAALLAKGEEEAAVAADAASYIRFSEQQEADKRREEIQLYSDLLADCGLSFSELADVSPKHADARKTAMDIAVIICSSEEMKSETLRKKRLPIKRIEQMVGVSRKTIERHRKYILAMVILHNSDLPMLQEYLKGWMPE